MRGLYIVQGFADDSNRMEGLGVMTSNAQFSIYYNELKKQSSLKLKNNLRTRFFYLSLLSLRKSSLHTKALKELKTEKFMSNNNT